MKEYIVDLIKYVFGYQNIWLLIICVFIYGVYKIIEIYYHYMVVKKLKQKIVKQCKTECGYENMLHNVNEYISRHNYNNNKDYSYYNNKAKYQIEQMDTMLDKLWFYRQKTVIYSSKLSTAAADEIMQNIIREISFMFWQLDDIIQLGEDSPVNKKEIVNNMTGYADINIFKEYILDKIDQKIISPLREKGKLKNQDKYLFKEFKILNITSFIL